MLFVSSKIRERLNTAGKRYFACDNISEFIKPGELDQLKEELARSFEDILNTLIIDIDNDPNSEHTAQRMAKMYIDEIMSGRYYPAPKVTAFPNENYTGLIVVRAEIKSLCAHHHQPITGVCYIGCIPYKRVIGLSKYIRIAQWCARRGQLQEELCEQIANEITKATESQDVGVYIGAEHGCCTNRGVHAHSALTQTTVLQGVFKEADVKKEFFDNIQLQERSVR